MAAEPLLPVSVHRFESDLRRFGTLVPMIEAENARLRDFDGRRHQKAWRPITVKVVDDMPRSPRRLGDLCSLGVSPVVSERTCEAYDGMLQQYGELLPILLEGGQMMFVYNVTTVLDCLDRKNTRGFWLDRERLADGRRYAFRRDVVQTAQFFRIPEQLSAPTFATSTVLAIAQKASLTAFSCPEVWPVNSAEDRGI